MYNKLGAHLVAGDPSGTHFAVWAPNAQEVSVIGDFNGWQPGRHPLEPRASSGVWEGFLPGLGQGTLYKYAIRNGNFHVDKADPIGFAAEIRPQTASKVWDLSYTWNDGEWMARRGRAGALEAPITIYEVHLGSWRRVPEQGNRWPTYRELAAQLPGYVHDMGYT
ncbi:MAG: 1,4-alpha-glucan branching enzyme, partial [Planctomycetes bacterium]|nr:1,4-alpha-glucan branching enzyme [Planctomycetota bacterium]